MSYELRLGQRWKMAHDPNQHVVGAVLDPTEAHCLLFDLLSHENDENSNGEEQSRGSPVPPQLRIRYRFSGESREMAEASTEPLEFTQAVPWEQSKHSVRTVKVVW